MLRATGDEADQNAHLAAILYQANDDQYVTYRSIKLQPTLLSKLAKF